MSDGRLHEVVSDVRMQRLRGDFRRHGKTMGRLVFGDRTGVVIWLGIVLVLGLCWRVGFFITDTYPIANAVANLAEGRLAMQASDFQYSLTLGTQPGLHESGGAFYARNYGHVVAAVPILWVLDAVAVVGSPRLILAGAWSLGVLTLGRYLATLTHRAWFRDGGAVLAMVSFVLAAVFATDLGRGHLPLVALQLSSLFAAGLVGVFGYRLVATFHGRHIGIVSGIGIALATPIAFWATIPKRHVFVTALVFASVYGFARSRQRDDHRSHVALGVAYGSLGILAWVHAFEGFFLTVALFVVDSLTQPQKSRRQVAIVAGCFGLSLLPMIVTNLAISGNPLQPPRLLPNVGPGSVELAPDVSADSGGVDGNGSGDGSSADGNGDSGNGVRVFDGVVQLLAPVFGVLAMGDLIVREIVFIGTYAVETVTDGLRVAQDLDRLWNVFVQRGYDDYGRRLAVNEFELVDLTVLESTPLLGSLLALPAVVSYRVRRGIGSLGSLPASRQTDLLVVTYIAVLTVVYLPRLPLFSQLTVRYLLPVMTLAAYSVIRVPAVHETVDQRSRLLASTYVETVGCGTFLVVIVLRLLDPALGEAIQFHALVNRTLAGLLALAVVGRTVGPKFVPRSAVAVALALAGGGTTVYVVLAALEYFTYGSFAFDVVTIVAEHVTVV